MKRKMKPPSWDNHCKALFKLSKDTTTQRVEAESRSCDHVRAGRCKMRSCSCGSP